MKNIGDYQKLLIEKTVKIIKKVAKDRSSQVDWNPELKKGVKEEKMKDKTGIKEEMREVDLMETKELGKLFPELKDNPTSHRERMVHSVTRYDNKKQEAAAKDSKNVHNPHALGQYLGAVDRAHEDMTKGFSPADAINHHFNGTLANHLHKHCGSGGVDKDTMKKIHEKETTPVAKFDENQIRYGVSRSMIEAAKGVLTLKKQKKIKKVDDGGI